jgi:hypothetical protein
MVPSVLTTVALCGLLILGSNAQVPNIESNTAGDITLTAAAGDVKVPTAQWPQTPYPPPSCIRFDR